MDHMPPLAVLDALRRPRTKADLLTPSEVQSRRRKAKESSAFFRKAFAHLRPAEVSSGDHMPPPHVLLALRVPQVRRLSPATTKYHFSPLRLHEAAKQAREERARAERVRVRRGLSCPDYVLEIARKIEEERKAKGIVDTRVIVRRGRLVLALEPHELGPDDEVIPADDPYFRRKKGRPRAVVEVWAEAGAPLD